MDKKMEKILKIQELIKKSKETSKEKNKKKKDK